MELWVRSQDKRQLCKAQIIDIIPNGGVYNIQTDFGLIGRYDSEKRCLEILDEIQKLLIENSDPLVLICDSIDDTDIQDGAIIECSPKEKAKVFQKSILVYEMPEK